MLTSQFAITAEMDALFFSSIMSCALPWMPSWAIGTIAYGDSDLAKRSINLCVQAVAAMMG